MPTPILWPLGKKIHPWFAQQRPKWTGGLAIPRAVVNLPWNAVGHPTLYDLPVLPQVVHQLMPIPPTFFQISEQTKDSTGAALGSATAKLFVTTTDVKIETQTSNADGYVYFKAPAQAVQHYVVAYKAGSPDVAGTTVNTLVGT